MSAVGSLKRISFCLLSKSVGGTPETSCRHYYFFNVIHVGFRALFQGQGVGERERERERDRERERERERQRQRDRERERRENEREKERNRKRE